jgi:hypothetical protein
MNGAYATLFVKIRKKVFVGFSPHFNFSKTKKAENQAKRSKKFFIPLQLFGYEKYFFVK